MNEPTPIVMFGAAGRMGQMILGLASQANQLYQIVGIVEQQGHPQLGKPLSTLVQGADSEIVLVDEPPGGVPKGTVAIHFSSPEATIQHLEWSRDGGHPAVVGTTGLSAAGVELIHTFAAHVPILLTPNTSLGVNVLFWLAEQATRLLGRDYDAEIIELHHHHKKDAPSGTAKGLAEAVCGRAEGTMNTPCDMGAWPHRSTPSRGNRDARREAGDIVGDHTVLLAGPGERIELTHRAHTRETFARGALQAPSGCATSSRGFIP